ncbi:hypothetical protein EE612_013425 [Oryza sativa]|nr:hypothetical protein EE612_013425 [Oryza sativa]
MANDSSSFPRSLLIPLAAGGCSDDDDGYDEGPSDTVSFPSFWPPFPAILSDSDSDVAFFPLPPPHVDHCPAPQGAASAFFGLGFREEDDHDGGEWAPPGEVELPLCWDCLQLEEPDHQRWDIGVNGGGGDEWEQVGIRVEEEEEEEEAAAAVRSLEWEVLLATNSLGSLVVDGADYDGGIDTFFLDDADDVLFGQLAAEHEPPAAKGARAAAKAAVESLPTVVVDAARGDTQCAVCKDGMEAGERARRLPCAHLYHDGCILPWLAIRNTCPLCRHELPTDDPEYENWKARRAAAGGNGDGDRYGIIRQLSMID